MTSPGSQEPTTEAPLPPTPDPEAPTTVRATLPGFLHRLGPGRTTEPASPEDGATGYDEPPTDIDLPGLNSQTSPTTPSRVATGDPKAIRRVLELVLGIAGRVAHRVLTPGPEQTLWLMDDEDREHIAGPLSRIAARHTAIKGSEDLVDGIEATVGVGGYVEKNWDAMSDYAVWLQQRAQNQAEESQ